MSSSYQNPPKLTKQRERGKVTKMVRKVTLVHLKEAISDGEARTVGVLIRREGGSTLFARFLDKGRSTISEPISREEAIRLMHESGVRNLQALDK